MAQSDRDAETSEDRSEEARACRVRCSDPPWHYNWDRIHGMVIPPEIAADIDDLAERANDLPRSEAIRVWRESLWREHDGYERRERRIARENASVATMAEFARRRRGNWSTIIASQHERATRKGRPSTLTERQWVGILKAFDLSCAYCGTTDDITIDHLVPIARGGENAESNCVPACMSCNLSKGPKDLWTWLESQGIEAGPVFARIESAHVTIREGRRVRTA